ncbi:glycosyltransferase, partial [bacterium]|nr:glycosyltransferase [bacterium]
RRALRPLGDRCRFWGQQNDVRAVYAQLDALLTGLPEKEALGLNVIEAQACRLPVLAVDAPPFDETVADGITGWRYARVCRPTRKPSTAISPVFCFRLSLAG